MPGKNKNILLVEGKGERYSIPELMDYHTIWGDKPKDWVVEIKEVNGVDNVLKQGVISAESKTSGLEALGVIVDADDKFAARWDRLRQLCLEISGSVPGELPPEGLIYSTEKGVRIGIWIMPDNSSRGMMETFLAYLLSPGRKAIWELAKSTCEAARKCEHCHSPVHTDKAQIHTYLGLIDPPGQTLPDAIIFRTVDAELPPAKTFVSWMMKLFQLIPRDEPKR